ncbi:hypothetical protein EDE15_4217 [Edaphobacter aggregans]|uniref:Uncharacterized protein n=1 Tax=Edaphobacter aggregans TaxID=570835 RepID=A0A428MNX4_9BACT|nr:hypothetical protein EDE15_4217 [Edaphobacter aggregans]
METNAGKTIRHKWPREAHRLVQRAVRTTDKTSKAVLLHSQLEELTGHGSHACWRFLQRYGITRPGTGKRRCWDDPGIVDFVMEHGYSAASEKFGCSRKALYSFMQRQQRGIGHCSGQYGLNQLRKLLSVRVETIQYWISAGYLEASQQVYGGKTTYVVSDDQLRRFLTREAANMVPLRRFPEKRAEFLSTYLYDEKHMNLGLLRTRESKKEGEAYREYMESNRGEDSLADVD